MPGAHPIALRERVVTAYKNGEGSFAELGKRFNVGEASVNRWVNLERRTGSVAPKARGGARVSRAITPEAMKYLVLLVEDDPTWTTTELAEELKEALGIEVGRHTVGRALRRAGFTSKRGSPDRQRVGGQES